LNEVSALRAAWWLLVAIVREKVVVELNGQSKG